MYTVYRLRIISSFLMLLAAAGWSACKAQITIQWVRVNAEVVSPHTLFEAMVINQGGSSSAVIHGDLRSRSGEQVMSFSSLSFGLPSGSSTMTSGRPELVDVRYGNTPAGRMALAGQRLPEGTYEFCLSITASQGEDADQWCESVDVERMLFLDLVHPWDRDTLDETRPALTWTLSGDPASVQEAQVRLALAPMPKGINPAQAIAREVPVFVLPQVTDRTVPFPPGLAELVRGKCYAWQVERILEARVVDRSEPWGFCIRENKDPVPEKYILLDRLQPGAVYTAVDGRLYFRYDKPYPSEGLKAIVRSGGLQGIPVPVERDAPKAEGETVKSPGVGLYMLDLQRTDVRPGYHELTITDPKGGQYTLVFNYPR